MQEKIQRENSDNNSESILDPAATGGTRLNQTKKETMTPEIEIHQSPFKPSDDN